MIIINQDKTNIINFDRVAVIYLQENRIEYQCPDIEDFYGVLGNYKSEERAKEVLQEIAYRYTEYYQIKGGHSILNNGGYIQPNMFDFPKVYEMPIE